MNKKGSITGRMLSVALQEIMNGFIQVTDTAAKPALIQLEWYVAKQREVEGICRNVSLIPWIHDFSLRWSNGRTSSNSKSHYFFNFRLKPELIELAANYITDMVDGPLTIEQKAIPHVGAQKKNIGALNVVGCK